MGANFEREMGTSEHVQEYDAIDSGSCSFIKNSNGRYHNDEIIIFHTMFYICRDLNWYRKEYSTIYPRLRLIYQNSNVLHPTIWSINLIARRWSV